MVLPDFYQYKEIEGDDTKQDILDKKLTCGYINVDPLIYDNSFILLHNSIYGDQSLVDFELRSGNPNFKRIRRSIDLWGEMGVNLHCVDCFDSLRNVEIDDVHPSEIPIYINQNFAIEYSSYLKAYDCIYFDLTGESKVLIDKIVLSKLQTLLTICVYNHEITHTQLVSLIGSTKDILNSEVLPIFMESVFADSIDKTGKTLDIFRKIRLIDIQNKIFELATTEDVLFAERIECDTYVKSSLEAIGLLNTYFLGDKKIKREMLDDVNKVFSGEETVEDMLVKYDSTLECVPKDLKYLRKTL